MTEDDIDNFCMANNITLYNIYPSGSLITVVTYTEEKLNKVLYLPFVYNMTRLCWRRLYK